MSKLVPATFTVAFSDGPGKAKGFVVPNTDDKLAVYERWVDHWHITHVPTGRAVMAPYSSELSTIEQACGFARRFYAEAVKLGADLASDDWQAIQRVLIHERGYAERAEFWERVL